MIQPHHDHFRGQGANYIFETLVSLVNSQTFPMLRLFLMENIEERQSWAVLFFLNYLLTVVPQTYLFI